MKNENAKFKVEFLKRLIRFSLNIINFAAELRKNQILKTLADQLIRSATSVGANIVEAQGSGTKRDYINFFHIALKSANETKYWLILIKESPYHFDKQASLHLTEVDEISRIIGASILTMKGKK